MRPVLLAIIGRKGAGKSEILETLIAHLKEKKQLRIGVIKHFAREDFEIDQPGKDTYRYRMQGAETVMLLGKKKRAVFSDLHPDSDWEESLNYFEGFDLVFLEGYFLKNIPTMEIYKKELGEPLLSGMENAFAVCSDTLTEIGAPHFPRNQLEKLVVSIASLCHFDEARRDEEKSQRETGFLTPLQDSGVRNDR